MPDDGRIGVGDNEGAARSLPVLQSALLGDGVEHAEVAVFIFDEDGRYVAANDYGAALLGLTRAELLGRKAGDFTIGNPPPADILPHSRREAAQMIRRADGEWIPVAFVVVPTRVSGLPFRISVVWELSPDDARAERAAAELRERQLTQPAR